ncbi:MAG: TIGR01841 family phasin [Gammaproteobacteria bacterium]|nr:TIGR01841 family phasin [Gammaproteobacteria bacterium]
MSRINETLRRRVVGPITNLLLLNVETTAAILLRQGTALTEAITQGVDQARQLAETDGFQDAVRSQKKYLQKVAEQLTDAGRDNIQTIRDSGERARDVVRAAFSAQSEEQPAEDIAAAA